MTKFTIIAMAILAASGIQSYAQKAFTHNATTAQIKKAAKLASNTPIYMPTHEKEYEYVDGEWLEGGDYNYEYDKHGNILVNSYDDGSGKMVTTATYNADNLWTEQITQSAEGEDELVNSERKTRKYDSKVKDLVVEHQTYAWDGTNWFVQGNGNSRKVSRDEKGNVTGVIIATWYNNRFTPVERTSVTYDDLGLPGAWTHETLNFDNAWEEAQTLKAMTWQSTDGQIVTNDYTELFDGNNRLKKAEAWNAGVQTGLISAKYDETGATKNRTVVFTYLKVEGSDEPYGCDSIEYVYTDNYGSFTATQKYYSDNNEDGELTPDELSQTIVAKIVYDAHGNNILAESYEDGELASGTKNEYVYDETTGAQKEMISSEYNYDLKQYEPFVKIVSDTYVDVTAGIDEIKPTANAATGVYTLQGVKVGNTIEGLSRGIYIVNKGGKATKVVLK